MSQLIRQDFETMDQNDPLSAFRDEFDLPEGVIYFNGNSLGPLPRAVPDRVAQVTREEWGRALVRGWNTAGWFDMPRRLGAMLAPLIGVHADEVVVTDQTGLNVFKAVAAALSLRPERRVIVMEGSNFPTDNYTVQGLVRLMDKGYEIRFAEKDGILDAIDETVAVVALTDVHYKTSHILDMKGITAKAHAVGALAVWDLCHSAGVVPVDLNGCNADFGLGCSYKYLNGGPGGPGFIFIARRHQGKAWQPLTGWWGHEAPFAFDRDYKGAPNANQMLSGTQPIITMAASEAGLEIATRAAMKDVREKSRRMGDLFIQLMEQRCGNDGFTLVSPRNGAERGGHVAYDHENGYPIMRAMIARNVIGDFRAPATIRFGFSPLFLRYQDVWDAVENLSQIMISKSWDSPAFQERATVT